MCIFIYITIPYNHNYIYIHIIINMIRIYIINIRACFCRVRSTMEPKVAILGRQTIITIFPPMAMVIPTWYPRDTHGCEQQLPIFRSPILFINQSERADHEDGQLKMLRWRWPTRQFCALLCCSFFSWGVQGLTCFDPSKCLLGWKC